MTAILHADVAQIVLAYLFDQKLDQVGKLFCKQSSYLENEYNLVRNGYKPIRPQVLKLVKLFREYCEIDAKLNSFLESNCDNGTQQKMSELSPSSKLDYVIGFTTKTNATPQGSVNRETAKKAIKRKRPTSPNSIASSTPETAAHLEKRQRINASFSVVRETEDCLDNLSASTIADADDIEEVQDEQNGSTQANAFEEFSKTMLEHEEFYGKTIADMINKAKETSVGKTNTEQPPEGKEPSNFNFEEVIDNILEIAVNDPAVEHLLQDMSMQIESPTKEEEAPPIVTERDTPLKSRLRTRANKPNYGSVSHKKPKGVKVISDIKVTTPIDDLKEMTKDKRPVTKISGTDYDQPIASTSTQFWVIPNEIDAQNGPPPLLPITNNLVIPENTFLVYTDSGMPLLLNSMADLGSPLKYLSSVPYPSTSKQSQSAFVPFSVPSTSFLPTTNTTTSEEQFPTSVPIITTTSAVPQLTTFSQQMAEGSKENSTKKMDKVLSQSTSKVPISEPSTSYCGQQLMEIPPFVPSAGQQPQGQQTSQVSATSQSTLPRPTFTVPVPSSTIKATENVKSTEEKRSNTPQNASIMQNTTKCLSTPSRKATHIRTLRFTTPQKSGQPPDVRSSAPATTDRSRKVINSTQLEKINETLGNTDQSLSNVDQENYQDPVDIIASSSSSNLALMNENSMSNTPKVAKNPKSCVRVLSRSTSENGEEAKSKTEQKKSVDPSMEEWNRVRMQSSGKDFDQYLRKQQEEQMRLEQMNMKKKKRCRKKKKPEVEQEEKSVDISNISTDLDISDPNCSLTDIHAQQLEDALKSAKKCEKIFVKIQTPKKKTPMKKNPKKQRKFGIVKRNKPKIKQRQVVVEEDEGEYVDKCNDNHLLPSQEPVRKEEVGEKEEEVNFEELQVEKEVQLDVNELQIEEEELQENIVYVVPDIVVEGAVLRVEENHLSLRKVVIDEQQLEAKSSNHLLKKRKSNPKKIVQVSIVEQKETEMVTIQAANLTEPIETVEPVVVEQPVENKQQPSEDIKEEETVFKEPPPSLKKLCNVDASLLETPYKMEIFNVPITPRFMEPAMSLDTPISRMFRSMNDSNPSLSKLSDIMTPHFPITPGALATPKLVEPSPHGSGNGGGSSRRTDYSSGSSYYKPDESEDLDRQLDLMLQKERDGKKRGLSDSQSGEKTENTKQILENEKIENMEVTETEIMASKHVDTSISSSSSSSESSNCSVCSSSSSSSDEEEEMVKEKNIILTKKAPLKIEENDESNQSKAIKNILQNDNDPNKNSMYKIYDERARQQTELEAKRKRVAESLKSVKQSLPMRRDNRATVVRPKKILSAKEEILRRSALTAPLAPSVQWANQPSKRKNPTPKKINFLDKPLPQIKFKNKSPNLTGKAASKIVRAQPKATTQKQKISEKPELPVPNPKMPAPEAPVPTQPILEASDNATTDVFESENFPKLYVTPDHPEIPQPIEMTEKPNVYAETVTIEPSDEDHSDSETSESDLDFTKSDEIEASTRNLVYDENNPTKPHDGNMRIIPLTVVWEGQRVCLSASDTIELFELAEEKPIEIYVDRKKRQTNKRSTLEKQKEKEREEEKEKEREKENEKEMETAKEREKEEKENENAMEKEKEKEMEMEKEKEQLKVKEMEKEKEKQKEMKKEMEKQKEKEKEKEMAKAKEKEKEKEKTKEKDKLKEKEKEKRAEKAKTAEKDKEREKRREKEKQREKEKEKERNKTRDRRKDNQPSSSSSTKGVSQSHTFKPKLNLKHANRNNTSESHTPSKKKSTAVSVADTTTTVLGMNRATKMPLKIDMKSKSSINADKNVNVQDKASMLTDYHIDTILDNIHGETK